MNWRLPRRYRDYLPDIPTDRIAHYFDTDRIADHLPSRHRASHWFDRRPDNTGLTVAIGVGAAAMIGLFAGAYLLSRDRLHGLDEDGVEDEAGDGEVDGEVEGRSDFGH